MKEIEADDESHLSHGSIEQRQRRALVEVDLFVEGWYRGLGYLLAATMGMENKTSSPANPDTGVYKHFIDLSPDLSTRARSEFEAEDPDNHSTIKRRGTLGIEKSVSIWELASLMFDSVSMQSNPQRTTFTFNGAAYSLGFDTAANASSSNWAVPPNGSQLLFSDMTVYLTARDHFYIYSSTNNLILNESSNVTLTLSDGTYTGYELAQEIANKATNNATLTGTYTCSYSEETRKFTIKSDVSFSIIGTGDANETIGFTTASTSSALEQGSPYEAKVYIPQIPWSASTRVGVNAISWSLENNLAKDNQDSESGTNITAF